MPDPSPGQLDGSSVLRVLEVARKLAIPCELNELLELVINVGREVLTADRGSVFLYDNRCRELYTTVATGAKEIRIGIDYGIAGECARTRKIINVPDCYADPRFNRDVDKKTGYHTRCSLTVPLIGLEDELVGVTQLLNPTKPTFDADDERVAEALASQAAVAIQRARLIEERMVKLRMERDLALARQIQLDVLPKDLPECEGYDLATFSQPADETGGDIYDLVKLAYDRTAGIEQPSPLVILLADATGHGIGPALSVTQARAMLRIGLRFSDNLDELVANINRQLEEDLAANRFITAFLGILDPSQHQLVYHAAGQGPLLHYRAADARCDVFNASTVPLGIFAEPPLETPEPIELARGDFFVLLTDGFYEYQNDHEQSFGDERVTQVIKTHAHQSANEVLQHLLTALRSFARGAPQADDLTAIILKRM